MGLGIFLEFDLNEFYSWVLDPYHVSPDTSKTFSEAGYSEAMPLFGSWQESFFKYGGTGSWCKIWHFGLNWDYIWLRTCIPYHFCPWKPQHGTLHFFQDTRRKCKVGKNAVLGLSEPELVRNACFYIELVSVTYGLGLFYYLPSNTVIGPTLRCDMVRLKWIIGIYLHCYSFFETQSQSKYHLQPSVPLTVRGASRDLFKMSSGSRSSRGAGQSGICTRCLSWIVVTHCPWLMTFSFGASFRLLEPCPLAGSAGSFFSFSIVFIRLSIVFTRLSPLRNKFNKHKTLSTINTRNPTIVQSL